MFDRAINSSNRTFNIYKYQDYIYQEYTSLLIYVNVKNIFITFNIFIKNISYTDFSTPKIVLNFSNF